MEGHKTNYLHKNMQNNDICKPPSFWMPAIQPHLTLPPPRSWGIICLISPKICHTTIYSFWAKKQLEIVWITGQCLGVEDYFLRRFCMYSFNIHSSLALVRSVSNWKSLVTPKSSRLEKRRKKLNRGWTTWMLPFFAFSTVLLIEGHVQTHRNTVTLSGYNFRKGGPTGTK